MKKTFDPSTVSQFDLIARARAEDMHKAAQDLVANIKDTMTTISGITQQFRPVCRCPRLVWVFFRVLYTSSSHIAKTPSLGLRVLSFLYPVAGMASTDCRCTKSRNHRSTPVSQ